MSQVSIGPDGEKDKSWVTAGVLCVHGAEQGESLYSMTLPLSLCPSISLSLSLKKTKTLEFLVQLLVQLCKHSDLKNCPP